jgi:hypothetical protein
MNGSNVRRWRGVGISDANAQEFAGLCSAHFSFVFNMQHFGCALERQVLRLPFPFGFSQGQGRSG